MPAPWGDKADLRLLGSFRKQTRAVLCFEERLRDMGRSVGLIAALLICPSIGGCTDNKAAVVVDPDSYPSIEEKEMGQLRWVLKLASQDVQDFTNFDARNQTDLTSYRYQIAFSIYFLAAEQYHKLPAWSEAVRPAMDRLIQKLLLKPVWEYWADTSKGVPDFEPNNDRPYAESHDPVGEKNIMYSGHVGHAVNLYQSLYRDMRWDKPGSIVFEWSDSERYVYDNNTLEEAMYRQMKDNIHHSICCEPNAVFPECNQHPVLSFVLYDRLHRTRLSEAGETFLEFFKKNDMIDPVTHEVSFLYLVKQGWTVSQSNPKYGNKLDPGAELAVKAGVTTLESATADGWVGAFMHAWQPLYIEQQYPFWKKNRLTRSADGGTELKWESWEPLVQYGFFAVLAAEIGDADVRDEMLRFADTHYGPVWQDGTYHYPLNYSPEHGHTNLTDKLIALARALPKNGLADLNVKPFGDSHFNEPEVASVDTRLFFLKRAVYDGERQALVVSTVPGTLKSGKAGFDVRRLDPSRNYRITLDGGNLATINGRNSARVEFDSSTAHDIVVYTQ
jgi:hypothetical protein